MLGAAFAFCEPWCLVWVFFWGKGCGGWFVLEGVVAETQYSVGGECNISLSMAVPVEEAVAALATFSLEVSVGFISLFCHIRHRCVCRFHSGFLFWVGRGGFPALLILAFIYWSLSLSNS